ncbi:MAG: DUF1145 domain-containing protein [Gammaproteobacteria bacterium]|nr:DUF1145 domain-containing protein [Gammaproteobacteria bacterium]
MNAALKLITAIFWICFALNIFRPFPEPGSTIVAWAGIVSAIAHLLEFFIKKKQLDEINAGGLHGFSQTLLFGFLYWLPLLRNK